MERDKWVWGVFCFNTETYIDNSTTAAYKKVCANECEVKWCGGGGVSRKGFFSSFQPCRFLQLFFNRTRILIFAYVFILKLCMPMVILHHISSSADCLPHSHSFIFSVRRRYYHRRVRFSFSSLYALSFLLCLRKSILECFKITRNQHKSGRGMEYDEGTRPTWRRSRL